MCTHITEIYKVKSYSGCNHIVCSQPYFNMTHSCVNLLIWALFGVILERSNSTVYYIKSSDVESCPLQGHPCLTLTQFSANRSYHGNLTLILLPGNHTLQANLSLSMLDMLEVQSNVTASVLCKFSSRLSFEYIERVYIRNVNSIGCGGNKVSNVKEIIISNTTFRGTDNSGTSLTLVNTRAEIVNCSFVRNQFGTIVEGAKSLALLTSELKWFLVGDVTGIIRIGGALIVSYSNISISNSKFEDNKAQIGGDIFTEDSSTVTISNSMFTGGGLLTNEPEPSFGGSIFAHEGTFSIKDSLFRDKNATVGGAIVSSLSTFMFNRSTFISNSATDHGGAHLAFNCTISIYGCNYRYNYAGAGAGVATENGVILVESSNFSHNTVERHAAALDLYNDFPTIRGCIFDHNVAHSFAGAVLFWLSNSKVYGGTASGGNEQTCNVSEQGCSDNNSSQTVTTDVSVTSDYTSNGEILFISNSAPTGAAIYVIMGTVYSCGTILFTKNVARLYGNVYFLDSNGTFEGHMVLSGNIGSFFVFNSNVTFSGCNRFSNCSPPKNPTASFKEGGALTLVQTTLTLKGQAIFERNHAEIGGAIVATESKIYLTEKVEANNNSASKSGGAIYLSQSEMYSLRESTLLVSNNNAVETGGGIHALSSSIKCTVTGSKEKDRSGKVIGENYEGARVLLMNNSAPKGGALYLEANSKVTLLKDYIFEILVNHNGMAFIGNTASYGGAIYVDDESNSATCASNPFNVNSPKSECFIRVIATHTIQTAYTNYSLNNVLFCLNSANVSGSTLFGGLLDRCTVSLFNEVDRTIDMADNNFLKYEGNGLQYLFDISTGNSNQTISSYPAQLCLCINGQHDCSSKEQSISEFRKGETFNLSLIAVDQIYRPVNSTIQGYLDQTESNLIDGQITTITNKCTNISFQITSPYASEQLTLYASDGPCKDAELSRLRLNITFHPCVCPIGFQKLRQSTTCNCKCHSQIRSYVYKCNARTMTFQRRINVWISYVNKANTSGYLIYQYCPFDYCLLPNQSSPLNLNLPHGEDEQCALNRRGLLCGACKPGLSLSLGSSKCLKCPYYWPALFAVITVSAVVAGLALVVITLWLNMTVAVGTINGLLFYANVVSANRVVLLPYPEPNFITVFISWLNLELGIDVCYINGMDTYVKIWLQLAFPIYIILLVLLLIIISRYSTRFSELISKRNPVATLATLILISYGKLFHVVLLAQPFSVATLSYPNGDDEALWLPDGKVKYLKGKHIILFIVALIILFGSVIYSFLLLCWQLIIRLPDWKIFKSLKSPNLYLFMETYHVPYTPKHRYWTGMLLLARAIMYLIAAANVSRDPQIQLISIIVVMIFIILLKMFITTKIFKKWTVDILESFFCINIVFIASITSYNLSTENNQDGVAYTSVMVSIAVTLFIVLYHVYEYSSLLSFLKKSKVAWSVKKKFMFKPKRYERYANSLNKGDDDDSDDGRSRYDAILDISDYPGSDINVEYQKVDSHSLTPSQPTSSVVEMS